MARLQESVAKLKAEGSEDDNEEKVRLEVKVYLCDVCVMDVCMCV